MSDTTSARVVFTPSGLNGVVDVGTTVLSAARTLGVDVDSVCGGRGICGRCQVTPTHGDHPKWSIQASEANVSPWDGLEMDYQGKRTIEDGNRLGCSARIEGDMVFDVPASSQLHRQVIRKGIDLGDLVLDPVVTLHYLALDESDAPVAERLSTALADGWHLGRATVDPRILAELHDRVAAGPVTVAVRRNTIVSIWSGFVDRVLGVAVDVGSTTVAGHLCDLTTGDVLATAGRMNPQIRFGEDLMSRVSYAMLNEGGAAAMTDAIRSALDELVGELLAAADHESGRERSTGADRSHLLEMVIVGNPIMHHLVLGIDPTPLGQAPFPLATAEAVETSASTIGIDAPGLRSTSHRASPGTSEPTRSPPSARRAHTGATRSSSSSTWAPTPRSSSATGTSCSRRSSPTGPAFEGAQISAGQRATAGAIERVRIDRATLEPRCKVIGVDAWSDDPGFDPGSTGITGICGSGIIEVVSELFLAGVIDKHGVIDGDASARSDRIEPDGRTFRYRLTDSIALTQGDVRAIQLAKAALRAGIDLLLEHADIETGDEIRLAGAFGAHIDPVHAMVLGLIPDCAVETVHAVGNAAGSGAVRALLSGQQRRELESVARSVTKVETATEARFQESVRSGAGPPPRDGDHAEPCERRRAPPTPSGDTAAPTPRSPRGGSSVPRIELEEGTPT